MASHAPDWRRRDVHGQPAPSLMEANADREIWKYAGLVTSLTSEILTIGQTYRNGQGEGADPHHEKDWGDRGRGATAFRPLRDRAGCEQQLRDRAKE
jgi:hypothetical protein